MVTSAGELSPVWNKIRKKGTTLKNVKSERNALSTLHTTFTAKLDLYGKR